GRRPWRDGGRARLDDGARGDPRDRGLRRKPGRPADHARRARDALRDAALQLGSGQPALGRAGDDQRSFDTQMIVSRSKRCPLTVTLRGCEPFRPSDLILRSPSAARASRRMAASSNLLTWFETARCARLLTMRPSLLEVSP